MKKPTQSELILILLKQKNDWVKGYDLVKVWVKVDGDSYFLGTSADRQARQLVEDEKIKRRHLGKYAEYRLRDTTETIERVPEKSRVDVSHSQEKQEALLDIKYERE